MKSRLLLTTFLALLIPIAHGQDGFVVKPFAALVSMDSYTNGVAAGIGIGWPLPYFSQYMTAEAEYMKSFARMESSSGRRSFAKGAIFAALTYPFDPRIHFKGKVGLRYATYENSGTGDAGGNDIGGDFGLGAQVLLDNLRTVEIEYITSDENRFSQFLVGLRLKL